MKNTCVFSPCRNYRYTLNHNFSGLLDTGKNIAWIGLNPSTADEDQLDPTLRRVRRFSEDWGYSSFTMLNLFAFRATLPTVMKGATAPIGLDNDKHILAVAKSVDCIVACWGNDGAHIGRGKAVTDMLRGFPLMCIGKNSDGSPKHPLYCRADSVRVPFP